MTRIPSIQPAILSLLGAALASLLLSGCAARLIMPVARPVMENINRQSDLELVCDGAPSYLLMIDSLIAGAPDNQALLLSGLQAHAGQATIMPECGRPERAAAFASKAREYGLRLLSRHTGLANAATLPASAFSDTVLASVPVKELFWAAYGWALWIGQQQGAPAAMADLPKVEQLMLAVLKRDEGFHHGGAHLFLGIYHGARPPMLGGSPARAKNHFERAMVLGERRFLPALVACAEHYAKPTMDRELFTNLLSEVLAFDLATAPELTLANQTAKRRATRLLAQADEYF
ncbi:MAG: TRAP transporter TatT component family protein [Thermodesulfobacteriota bacterium]